MPGVRLIPIDDDLERDLEAGPGPFEARHGARLGECAGVALEVARQMLAWIRTAPRADPWGGYLALDEADPKVVGTCGFKQGPTPEGDVEIAYFTFPPFEGLGYATAMAGALVDLASGMGVVRRVLAHTLPERNASGRVLIKNGLRFVGEAVDPEDGPVWRWARDLGRDMS